MKFSMKSYKPFVMKSIQIIKTPSVHFIKKIFKTFTNKTMAKFIMILFIRIILFNQKTNECTINMSSHNSKPNHNEELTFLFQYKFFIVFINYTSKYTPQHRLIWDFFMIICNTSFWIEKITILQFSKNI